jgi:hypothetical protein
MKYDATNQDELVFDAGEIISVDVVTIGTAHLVTYSLDGSSGSIAAGIPLQITPSQPAVLTLTFAFSHPIGGRYDITVSGSAGGDVARFSIYEGDPPTLSLRLLPGSPTTPVPPRWP